jgi:hypothetical protein
MICPFVDDLSRASLEHEDCPRLRCRRPDQPEGDLHRQVGSVAETENEGARRGNGLPLRATVHVRFKEARNLKVGKPG